MRELHREGWPFIYVANMAFTDHSLETQVTKVVRHTEDELDAILAQGETRRVYVLACARNVNDGIYMARYAIGSWKLAPLMGSLTVSTVVVNQGTFSPEIPINLTILTEALNDLKNFWGRKEVVSQLGEYIMAALETTYDSGAPPDECLDRIRARTPSAQ